MAMTSQGGGADYMIHVCPISFQSQNKALALVTHTCLNSANVFNLKTMVNAGVYSR